MNHVSETKWLKASTVGRSNSMTLRVIIQRKLDVGEWGHDTRIHFSNE